MDDRMLIGGPDKQVPPKGRRGTLVVPDEWENGRSNVKWRT
ncbi:hypothetical protein THTE_4375 [Thermogutta terrifontis]|uniref:Uncharacterized protein n=1 Tax=Thermogutta terrifontis TaxID=1331910 RepID=A0A286RLY2_9BACT|nr:hypothetical protein THTE_4375 [Thermogutta terrifontis]